MQVIAASHSVVPQSPKNNENKKKNIVATYLYSRFRYATLRIKKKHYFQRETKRPALLVGTLPQTRYKKNWYGVLQRSADTRPKFFPFFSNFIST